MLHLTFIILSALRSIYNVAVNYIRHISNVCSIVRTKKVRIFHYSYIASLSRIDTYCQVMATSNSINSITSNSVFSIIARIRNSLETRMHSFIQTFLPFPSQKDPLYVHSICLVMHNLTIFIFRYESYTHIPFQSEC